MDQAAAERRSGVDAGGMAGVLGIVLPMVGTFILPIWQFPSTGESGAQIAAFIAEHRVALQVVMVLNTVGVTLWSVFGAAVWTRLRNDTVASSIVPACFAAGLIGFITLLLAGFTAFDVIVYRRADAAESRLLYDMAFGLLAMSGMPTAVALGSYAIAIYRRKLLPRFTAHLAMIGAAAHVLLLLSFVTTTGFFSLEGSTITVIPAFLFMWILMTGLAMTTDLMHTRRHSPSPLS